MNHDDVVPGREDPDLFRDVFRRASSHIPTGVAVLACQDAQQRPSGLTVSSMACVSFAPPLVAVCIDRASPNLEHVQRHRHFSLNVLRDDQAALATRFAAQGDRFHEVAWHFSEFRVPVLDSSLGSLLCELTKAIEAGDHQLILGEVRGIVLRGVGTPLVHWRRAFHGLHIHHSFLESDEVLEKFVRAWESGLLPRSAWTHGAHVAVAAYYAFEQTPESVFQMMRSGIVHFNGCVGTANTPDSGYHETLTRFWAETVGRFVRDRAFASRLEAVRDAVREFGEDRDRHRLYYSFDVVRDRKARREWVRPDRGSRLDR